MRPGLHRFLHPAREDGPSSRGRRRGPSQGFGGVPRASSRARPGVPGATPSGAHARTRDRPQRTLRRAPAARDGRRCRRQIPHDELNPARRPAPAAQARGSDALSRGRRRSPRSASMTGAAHRATATAEAATPAQQLTSSRATSNSHASPLYGRSASHTQIERCVARSSPVCRTSGWVTCASGIERTLIRA